MTDLTYPIIMNCNFSKIKMEDNIYQDTVYEVRGSLKLGGLSSPFGGQLSMIRNHDYFMAGRQIGFL
ncbi:hypothetical protein ABER23_17310 [Paenibacillus lautus]|uniref:hypothetical protein n=1 Tax=Paenibacillus lautus TaxID=1401 RepID=UPI003D2DDC39